jgi:hypothetical protein
MLGRKAHAFGPLATTSLEQLVPADHCSRHLNRTLALAFVRDTRSVGGCIPRPASR